MQRASLLVERSKTRVRVAVWPTARLFSASHQYSSESLVRSQRAFTTYKTLHNSDNIHTTDVLLCRLTDACRLLLHRKSQTADILPVGLHFSSFFFQFCSQLSLTFINRHSKNLPHAVDLTPTERTLTMPISVQAYLKFHHICSEPVSFWRPDCTENRSLPPNVGVGQKFSETRMPVIAESHAAGNARTVNAMWTYATL